MADDGKVHAPQLEHDRVDGQNSRPDGNRRVLRADRVALRRAAPDRRAGHRRPDRDDRRVSRRSAGVRRRPRVLRADQFVEARAAFARADPAERDARTQFYIAYGFYRQGWGRVYNDDILFKQGLAAVDRAIALARPDRLVVEDPQLRE